MSEPNRTHSWHSSVPSSPRIQANSLDTRSHPVSNDQPLPSPIPPATSSQCDNSTGPRMSSILGNEPSHPVAHWEGAAKAMLFSSRSALTLFSIISAVVLTRFSSSGIVTFEGQLIKWKLLLYTLLLEATLLVFVRDILALGIDYLLVYEGMTRSQLGHALAVTTSLRRVQGSTYKVLFVIVTALGSVIGPVLLSVVLVRGGDAGGNRIVTDDLRVMTNCIGGRVGDNFGATGQSYLFNASMEKYRITPRAEHYAVYLSAGSARQVFVPKVPQIGPYSTECNSNEKDAIVEARVLDVEGLLYKCEPKVSEHPIRLQDYADVGKGSSNDTFRLLADDHKPAIGKHKATFNVTFAISKGEYSTAVLEIPCDVTSATASLDIAMNDAGIMGMSIVDEAITEQVFDLPPRVLGEMSNSLELALENSIGRKGIGIVSKWVAVDVREWDGLIRAVVAAYGIRSALQKTFADKDQKKNAVNVRKIVDNVEDTQNMRIVALWIPVALAVFSRTLSWIFPSIFNGGLRQVLSWMGIEKEGAGGSWYNESGFNEVKEKKAFIHVVIGADGGVSMLGLSETRDGQIALGSGRYIRRLTNRGLLRGLAWNYGKGTE